MKHYFYLDCNTNPQGPFQLDELRQRLKEGALEDSTLVCAEGDSEWRPLRDVLAAAPERRPVAPKAVDFGGDLRTNEASLPGKETTDEALPWEPSPEVVRAVERYEQAGLGETFKCKCNKALNSLTRPLSRRAGPMAQLTVYRDAIALDGRPMGCLGFLLAFVSLAVLVTWPPALVTAALSLLAALVWLALAWVLRLIAGPLIEKIALAVARFIREHPRNPLAVFLLHLLTPLTPRYWGRGALQQIIRVDSPGLIGRRGVVLFVHDEPVPPKRSLLGRLWDFFFPRRRVSYIWMDCQSADTAARKAAAALRLGVTRAAFKFGWLVLQSVEEVPCTATAGIPKPPEIPAPPQQPALEPASACAISPPEQTASVRANGLETAVEPPSELEAPVAAATRSLPNVPPLPPEVPAPAQRPALEPAAVCAIGMREHVAPSEATGAETTAGPSSEPEVLVAALTPALPDVPPLPPVPQPVEAPSTPRLPPLPPPSLQPPASGLALPPLPSFPPPASPGSLPPIPSEAQTQIPRQPTPRWHLAVKILVVAGLLVLYVQAPYRILYSLKKAALEGRIDVMERYIDFNSVRTSLVAQASQRLEVKVANTVDRYTAGRYRDLAYIEGVAGSLLQPKELASLTSCLPTNQTWRARALFPFFESATTFTVTARDIQLRFPVPSSQGGRTAGDSRPVEISLEVPEARLRFEFGDWTWRLNKVELPQRVLCEVIPFALPPVILETPRSLVVQPNRSAHFHVTTGGDQPMSFQWRLNGQDLPSGTASSLDVFPVSESVTGAYTVVVSNAGGCITSPPATLTMSEPPTPSPSPPSSSFRPEWTGQWMVNDRMRLVLKESFGSVAGTVYPPDSSTSYAISGTVFGRNLNATFMVTAGSRIQRCSVSLSLSQDNDSFFGTMRNNSTAQRFDWVGRRISASPD